MSPTLDAPTAADVAALVYPSLEELTALLLDTPDNHRFLAKVKVGQVPAHAPHLGPCLPWTGATNDSGYAVFRSPVNAEGKRKLVTGHVWLHTLLYGPVPPGHELDHICHDPDLCTATKRECPHRRCVLHTQVRTVSDNRRRANHIMGVNARKTTCDGKYSPRTADGELIGHDWSIPGNLRIYTSPSGKVVRICVPCETTRKDMWLKKVGRLKVAAGERGLAEAGQLELAMD